MQDQNSLHVSSKEIIAYFLIPGISQGAGFWFLSEYGFGDDPGFGHEGDFLFQPLMFFCAAAPTAFFLTTREGFRFKPLIFAGILGTVTSLLYILAINSSGVPGLDPTNETIFWTCWLANLLICYISVPFFRTVFEQGKPANHYPSLFQFAWNLPVILLIAGLFNAALWIVLWLWISLFNVIDISFLRNFSPNPP